jgi:hypothetical protein
MKGGELGPLKAVLAVSGVDLSGERDAMQLGAFIGSCPEDDRRELKWLLSRNRK